MTASSPDATTIAIEVPKFSGGIVKLKTWMAFRGGGLYFIEGMAGIIILSRGGGLRYLKFVLK